MLKLLITLVLSTLIGVLLLQLRQQRLQINHQTNQLHQQIESAQIKLWNQQLQIAAYTAPNAVFNTVNTDGLKMVPRIPPPAPRAPVQHVGAMNPDAE
jgi:cell division protein FtsL